MYMIIPTAIFLDSFSPGTTRDSNAYYIGTGGGVYYGWDDDGIIDSYGLFLSEYW